MGKSRRNKIESDSEEEVYENEQRMIYDSSEDDEIENEEELLAEEGRDFIADEDEESADDFDYNAVNFNRNKVVKRSRDTESEEEDLLNEVKDLTQNTVRKRRLVANSDEEELEEEEQQQYDNNRNQYNRAKRVKISEPNLNYDEESDEMENADDDLTDFIVDRPVNENANVMDTLTNEEDKLAVQLFACDMDFGENNDVHEDDIAEADDEIDEEQRKTFEESGLYNYDDIARAFLTKKDMKIKETDIPERLQQLKFVKEDLDINSLKIYREARHIYKRHFTKSPASEKELIKVVSNILVMLRCDNLEIPFIYGNRKDIWKADSKVDMSLDDLYTIFNEHLLYIKLETGHDLLVERINFLKTKVNMADYIGVFDDFSESLDNVRKNDELKTIHDMMTFYFTAELNKYFDDKKNRVSYSITIYREAGLDKLTEQFCLKPFEFSKNIREKYCVNKVENPVEKPKIFMENYLTRKYSKVDVMLRNCRSYLAESYSVEFSVRNHVEQFYLTHAKMMIRPTAKGLNSIINYEHELFNYKFITDKPISDLMDNYIYLIFSNGVHDELIEMELYLTANDRDKLCQELYGYLANDDINEIANLWNQQRREIINEMLDKFLLPNINKLVKYQLSKISQNNLEREIGKKFANRINYKYECQEDEQYFMAIVCNEGNNTKNKFDKRNYKSVMGVITDCYYNVIKTYNLDDMARVNMKVKMNLKLEEIFLKYKPSIVLISADVSQSLYLERDIKQIETEMDRKHDISHMRVEMVCPDYAKLYEQSSDPWKVKNREGREDLINRAIGLIMDYTNPLLAFSRMFNFEKDIKKFKIHRHQHLLNDNLIYREFKRQMLNAVSKTGVDFNLAVAHKTFSSLLQFVPGLGPRKSQFILDTIRQTLQCDFVSSRTSLIENGLLTQCIAINALPYLIIRGDGDFEFLDSTRIHNENYDIAMKIIRDALDLTEEAPIEEAIDMLIENNEVLSCLDTDSFSDHLLKTNNVRKHEAIKNIIKELRAPYYDERPFYESLTDERKFYIISGENPEYLQEGVVRQFVVLSYAYRKPREEDINRCRLERSDVTGKFVCPFCKIINFEREKDVINHLQRNQCEGSVIGYKCIGDESIPCFLHKSKLTDNRNDERNLKIDDGITAAVIKINFNRYQLELSLKQSDIEKFERAKVRRRDRYYDEKLNDQAELRETLTRAKIIQEATSKQIDKSLVFHPNYKSISYADFLVLFQQMEVGDYIFRPSSQAANSISATVKFTDNVVEIYRLEHCNDGKLRSEDGAVYEGFDDFITNFLSIITSFVREIYCFKYFIKNLVLEQRKEIEEMIKCDKAMDPKRIPYLIFASKEHPGEFGIVFMTNRIQMYKFKVDVNGYEFERQKFHDFIKVINKFKGLIGGAM